MKSNRHFGKNVISATYERAHSKLNIYKETYIPPESLFMPIGFDLDPSVDEKIKHYRRFYHRGLELLPEIMQKTPFDVYSIKRGQSRGLSKGFFSKKTDESG
jgi:hypothetical protein